jgi:NAD+ diphosphatase
MVGFTARYESGTLLLQKEELGGGGWFTLNNLPELPAQGSIAREMIDDWISEQKIREQ